MNPTAKSLASHGRHGDSMLVHMSPAEVGGLQALAKSQGTSLSINPNTGLPEAFKLKQLLPMVIGAALTPIMGPMAAGLVVGGVETARTGDLSRGIMAGLGAFGGAGLASGLSAAGAATAGTAAGTGAATTGAIGAPSAIGGIGGTASGLSSTAGGITGLSGTTGALGSTMPFASAAAPQGITNLAASAAPSAVAPLASATSIPTTVASTAAPSFSNMATGLQNVFSTDAAGTAARSGFMEGMKTALPSTSAKIAATVGLAGNLAPTVEPIDTIGQNREKAFADFKRRFGYDPRDRTPTFAADGGQLDTDPGLNGYAKGGLPIAEGSFIMPARETAEFGNGSSNAGLAALSRMGARPIQGPGDGVSDSIRANIGGKQEARLARDEAYFPPEAVKRIGGGSHKKGTKKLYAMMKAAQEARKKADRGQDTGLRGLLA